MSYYSYPFISYDRKEPGMLPVVQPLYPIPQVPVSGTPLTPDEMIDVSEPSVPVSPIVPGTPLAPLQPGTVISEPQTTGIMPICPFMPFTGHTPDAFGMEQFGMPSNSQYFRQPQPVLSNPPPTTAIVLTKELTGFPNYGNPSGNADILYTGTRGVWTFNIPAFLFVPGNLRAQIVIRAVLDDHAAVPVSSYSARITVNGTVVHNGRLPLPHGQPAGSRFNNWRLLTFDVPNLRRTNQVVIVNTSTAGPNDWIAFDWMELRIFTR